MEECSNSTNLSRFFAKWEAKSNMTEDKGRRNNTQQFFAFGQVLQTFETKFENTPPSKVVEYKVTEKTIKNLRKYAGGWRFFYLFMNLCQCSIKILRHFVCRCIY